MSLNNSQINAYFKRIKCETEVAHNGEFLSALVKKHLENVPYENFDILQGIELKYDTETLFNKIVASNRGGYCFELNALFGTLLRSLNFEVADLAARFLLDEKEIPMRRHRVLRVKADDGNYLVDIATGVECPRMAIKLEEGTIQSDGICKYRLEIENFFGWVLYQKENNKSWQKLFSFTEEEQLEQDFTAISFYCEKSEYSPFNKGPILSIRSETGRITCGNRTFKRYEGTELVDEYKIEDDTKFLNEVYKIYSIKL